MKLQTSGYLGLKHPVPFTNALKKVTQPIPRFTSFRLYVTCTQTHHLKLNAPIGMYDAENILDLLNSHDQELTVYHLIESQKQSTREEAEEPKPEPKGRTMTVLKLAVWIGLIESGIRTLEDIYWNEQQLLDTEL
jgi:hypothetical protein